MSDRSTPGQLDSFPILATKLYRPPVPSDAELRSGLIERLDQYRQRPLTLISAPAGYGKTTLASMWLEANDCPSAWVSLDEHDNDLRTFTSYLVAALLHTFPVAKLKIQDLLEVPTMPPAPMLARYLLNDLDQIKEPFILALDDLYMIREQAIFDLLKELLRHPASTMHLLLITRRDPPLPIASLRARRQVTEIRAQDLRFTAPEAVRLMSRLLRRAVDQATAAKWTRQTEGWVTALQLAALSLRHRHQDDSLRDDIPGDSQYLQDYLLAEVLGRLPPVRKEWLLATSLLDRFCAPLCDAVCQFDADSEDTLSGKTFVRWLQDDNLFLIPLDDQQRWFRFHRLFQQLLQRSLRERFEPGEIAALHLRAGNWFDENNLWDEALQHAMASGDAAAAVQLVVRHRYDLMNSEQWHRLEHWLQLFPVDVVNQDPYLTSIRVYVAIHMHSTEFSDTAATIRHAERLLTALPPESEAYRVVLGEIAVNQSVLDLVSGRPTRALANAQRSLQVLPAQALFARLLGSATIAASLQMQGEYKLAVAKMEETLAGLSLPPNLQATALYYSCFVHFLEGDLPRAIESSRRCLRIGSVARNVRTISRARQQLGVAHYLRNELQQAERHLRALLDDRSTSGPNALTFGTFALMLIHMSRGQCTEAAQIIELGQAELAQMKDTFATTAAEAFGAELALRKGDLAEAQRLSVAIDFDARPPSWYFYVPQLTPIKLLLAEGTLEGLTRARAALESLDERMAAIHRKAVRIDVLSLLALVCDAQGDTVAAYDRLAEALHFAELGGFIRNFVDLGPSMADLLGRLQRDCRNGQRPSMPYIARILRAFQEQDQNDAATRPPSPEFSLEATRRGMVEPLTRRELQVLRLLATDLSPQEIAGELTVATSTVRKHISNIYGKLGVHSRFQAAYRAQELELL